MMNSKKMMLLTVIPFFLLSIALIGCGGGGGGDAATPAPSLEVFPPSPFDFGTVTDDNSAQPLEVTLRNGGTANLIVSNIALSNTTDFSLDLITGAEACGSTTPTIAAGSSCKITAYFTPPTPPAPGSSTDFSANLTITSNDPNTPEVLSLLGTLEDIKTISVKINQVDACPRASASVYVSVVDQGGFPVTGLVESDFTLAENGGTAAAPISSGFVNDTVTLSVALLMDYSGSITMEPVNVTDMENAALNFVGQLGDNDEAEIIKFAETVEVTQSFTADNALLVSAIQRTPNIGSTTALYDAIVRATADISSQTTDRRAIIVITDGMDLDGSGVNRQSTSDLSDVILAANANGVPVFTVGLGNADIAVLQQIADETGGTFSDSTTSANLSTIYQQLANLLFTDQYILTYNSGVAEGSTGNLTVTATYAAGVSGTDTKLNGISTCP